MTRPLIDDFVARHLQLTVRGRLAAASAMLPAVYESPFDRGGADLPPHSFCEALYSGINIRRSGQEFQVWDSFNTQTIQIALPANAKVIFGVTLADDQNHEREAFLALPRPEPVQGTDGEAPVTLHLPVGSLRLCDQRPIDQPPPPPSTDGLTPGDYLGPPIHDRIASTKVATPGHRQRRWHKRYFFHKNPAKPSQITSSVVYRDQTGAIFYAEEFTRRPDGEIVTTAFEFED